MGHPPRGLVRGHTLHAGLVRGNVYGFAPGMSGYSCAGAPTILSALRWWIRFLYFFQELFDALNFFLGKIEGEMQFGDAAQLQAFDQFAADVTGGMLQSFYSAGLLLIGAVHADENAGVLHVLLHADFVGDDHAFETGVFELA